MSWRVRRDLLRPQRYALAAVLILAAVSAHSIERAPKTYLESALVVLAPQNAPSIDNPYATDSKSLITTSATMVESLMSPQSRALVRDAGGTTGFNLALVNFYNQDYPEYSYPFATLTAQSPDPVAAHRTFDAIVQVLRRLLAARQVSVPPSSQISVHVFGDTGPVLQPGSLKRSLAALGLLTMIAARMLSGFLDRHQGRLAALSPRYPSYLRLANRPGSHRVR